VSQDLLGSQRARLFTRSTKTCNPCPSVKSMIPKGVPWCRRMRPCVTIKGVKYSTLGTLLEKEFNIILLSRWKSDRTDP